MSFFSPSRWGFFSKRSDKSEQTHVRAIEPRVRPKHVDKRLPVLDVLEFRETVSDTLFAGAQLASVLGTLSHFPESLPESGVKGVEEGPPLWRECVETAVFVDLADARTRIGHFIDYYNFQRTHSGIGGLVPADRFFGAAPDVLRTLKERVAANACELARHGVPKPPFYMTGQVGGQSFSVHAEGERVSESKGTGVGTGVVFCVTKARKTTPVPFASP